MKKIIALFCVLAVAITLFPAASVLAAENGPYARITSPEPLTVTTHPGATLSIKAELSGDRDGAAFVRLYYATVYNETKQQFENVQPITDYAQVAKDAKEYTYTWNTTNIANGSYYILVEYIDNPQGSKTDPANCFINHSLISFVKDKDLYGWKQENGKWYRYGVNATRETGFWLIDKNYYYMDPANGEMATGWKQPDTIIGGQSVKRWYYFNSGGDMKTGWHQDSSKKWYYLSKDSADFGAMKTGWVMDGSWYYMDTSGVMLTGWRLVNNKWYYMNPSGSMKTGWYKEKNTWYYLRPNGDMAVGWARDGKKWYYMSSSGAMLENTWVKPDGHWYYLNSGGAMATGWKQVNKKWYYMKDSGAMMENEWLQSGSTWYYLQASGEMAANTTLTIDGQSYSFDSSGRRK